MLTPPFDRQMVAARKTGSAIYVIDEMADDTAAEPVDVTGQLAVIAVDLHSATLLPSATPRACFSVSAARINLAFSCRRNSCWVIEIVLAGGSADVEVAAAIAARAGHEGHSALRSPEEGTAWSEQFGSEAHFRAQFAESELLLLAREGEEAVGLCALTGGEVSLYCLRRGEGLGTRLLDSLLTEARQRGIRRLDAEIHSFNDPCLAVFLRAGFRKVSSEESTFFPGASFDRFRLSL